MTLSGDERAAARTAIFLSVRDKATRLPGKVRADICGKPAIVRLIDRLKLARLPNDLIMTTSIHPGDDELAAIARSEGIGCFRGSEEDKLLRYRDAARLHHVAFALVVDGDDLFCDPGYIDRIVEAWRAGGEDYIIVDHLPVGATAFGVSLEGLERVVALKAESDTEVWGGYFARTDLFRSRMLQPVDETHRRSDLRFTLDYAEDLAFFRAVLEALDVRRRVPTLSEIIAYLDRHPQVVAINAEAADRYAAQLRKAAPVRFKSDAALGAGVSAGHMQGSGAS
jgi:spore coat polysaccharide biosynthesis protein SpsF (cytidylyltransferase family)